MPGIATETHPVGYSCSQFYRTIRPQIYFFQNLGSGNSSVRSFDVTDNKTNELSHIYSMNIIYTMNDIFHREDERLKTFDHWPHDWLDKYQLAQTGMFYTGEDDKTKCYFCEVEIGRWDPNDHPVTEHLRWSPNCPLLRRRTTNNRPINAEALERVLPTMSYDVCGAHDDAIEVRQNSYAEGTIPESRMMAGNFDINSGTTYFPEYAEYAIEAARTRSFAEWPRHMKQKPEQLAEAGFFYTGIGDRVKCFSCGGGLKDWDDEDDPWEQHAIWLNKCRFLKLMKGQKYIDTVLAQQIAEGGSESVPAATNTNFVEQVRNKKPEESNAKLIKSLIPTTTISTSSIAVVIPTNVECNITNLQHNIDDNVIQDEQINIYNRCNETNGSNVVTSLVTGAKQISTSISEGNLCKICYADEYNTAFLPCGHVVACAKCASSVTKCPLCRKSFTEVMRVYFS